MVRDLARVVCHGKGLARGGLTRRREGHEGFLGMALVVGHGMTRKFTERDCRGGFNTKGAKAFLGMPCVVGHGVTQKFTERQTEAIGARRIHDGVHRRLARVGLPTNHANLLGDHRLAACLLTTNN